MQLVRICRTSALIALIAMIATLFMFAAPPTYAQRATNTPRPSATPKPPFEPCRPYPSATPRRNATPTETPDPDAQIIPTNTAVVPSRTPDAPTTTPAPVGIRPADAALKLRQSIEWQRGGKTCIVVYEVTPGGAADSAGIRAGDLILGIDKRAITELADFYDELAKRASGDVIQITVQRGGAQLPLPVTLGLSPFADQNATPLPTATPTRTGR
jgi:membrane-associated protease RseP (regulator of RpoE activity)